MISNSIGFFKKFILSIVEQRFFPLIQKEKIWPAIGYFCKLIFFASVCLSIVATNDFFGILPDYIDKFESKTPNFDIIDGVIYVESGDGFEVNKNIYVDFTVNKEPEESTIEAVSKRQNDKYNTYVLVEENSVSIYKKLDSGLKEEILKTDYNNFANTNKARLIKECRDVVDSHLAKLIIFLGFIGAFFIAYGLYRLGFLVMYSFSAFCLNVIFMNKLKVKDYFKIAIYVSSLPILLEVVALIVTGRIPDAAGFVAMLIATVYVYYALRAIKLDTILVSSIGDTPEEKIKNAILNAQENLEKELKNIEEKEKLNEEAKDKIKDINDELNKSMKNNPLNDEQNEMTTSHEDDDNKNNEW